MPEHKIITDTQMGLWQGKVGWVFTYDDGRTESFALPLEVARSFTAGLQALIGRLEAQAFQGTQDGVGMSDTVQVRLV